MRALVEANASFSAQRDGAPPMPNLQQINARLEQFAAHVDAAAMQVSVSQDTPDMPAQELTRQRSAELCQEVVSTLVSALRAEGEPADPALAALVHRSGALLSGTLAEAKAIGANYAISFARDGGITTATTMLRELIGYAVVRHSTLSESQKAAIAAGIMGFAIVLNLAAMATHAVKGIGNRRTRLAQSINIGLLGVVMYVAHKTNILAGVMPLLVKAIAYSLLRDTANDFITMNDVRNTSGKPPGALAILIQMPLYAAVSIIVNYLQGSPGAVSGPAAAAKGLALKHALLPMLGFSAFNGLGEGVDGSNFSHAIAYEQSRARRLAGSADADGRKSGADVDLRVKLRVPTWSQYTDKVAGAMTGRASAFTVIYGLIGALSQVPMSDQQRNHFMNCMVGLAIGGFVAIFASSFSTSARAPRPAADPSPV